MALTKEEFLKLREAGLSVEQIVRIDQQQTAQTQLPRQQTGLEKFKSIATAPGRVIGGAGAKLLKGPSEFLFSTVAGGAGSIIGAGAESAKELVTGKPAGTRFRDEAEKRFGTVGKTLGTTVGTALEGTVGGLGEKTIAKVALKLKTPLTKAAEKLFQSAIKARDITKGGKVVTKAEDIVKTGLKERVWLTKGGVERVGRKILDLEKQLGEGIEELGQQGRKISTDKMKDFAQVAKDLFANQVDVKAAIQAIKEIDSLVIDFVKREGREMTIQRAQEVKQATYRVIKKYYGQMSGANIEGQKQIARGLKEGIVETAPKIGTINERLTSLFQFDKALQKASNRIGNLNLLGFGVKFATGARGLKGAAAGLLVDLLDKASVKSGVAIGLNELGKGIGKITEKTRIPISLLISNLIEILQREE